MKIMVGAGMRKLIFKFMWLYYTVGVVAIIVIANTSMRPFVNTTPEGAAQGRSAGLQDQMGAGVTTAL